MIERNSRYGSCALCHKMPGDHRMLEQRTYIAIDLKSFLFTDYEALEKQRQEEQAMLPFRMPLLTQPPQYRN